MKLKSAAFGFSLKPRYSQHHHAISPNSATATGAAPTTSAADHYIFIPAGPCRSPLLASPPLQTRLFPHRTSFGGSRLLIPARIHVLLPQNQP
uniref:Uncharacterized protein MANES_06G140400 n=1 Tax=Rhizophora mucronata TaxID=61149 RepID=A0A2P2KJ69_RHIMU